MEASDITWLIRVFHNFTKRKERSQEQTEVEADMGKNAIKVHFFVVHLHAILQSACWKSLGSELPRADFCSMGFNI